jgi:hypothetical protein
MQQEKSANVGVDETDALVVFLLHIEPLPLFFFCRLLAAFLRKRGVACCLTTSKAHEKKQG